MRPNIRGISPFALTALALTALALSPSSVRGLDWQIIQEEMGARARAVYPRGRVLLSEDFESDLLGDYPGHPGVTLVKDPDGNGRCAQISSSEYRLKDFSLEPEHWIIVGWKARNVSGKGKAYLEVIYKDVEGKPITVMGRHNLPRPDPRREASSGGSGAGWKQEMWSLNPAWRSTPRMHWTGVYPGARSVGLRFFHEPGDETVTLIDDIRVVDIQPLALEVIADTITDHQRLLATAGESIRGLPDSPVAGQWKQVVAAHSKKIASELKTLARQDPKSEKFIHGSDAPLLFALRLADAAKALQTNLTHPETILTYRTRPVPVLGPLPPPYALSRVDPVGVLPYASQIEGELANEVTIQACPGEYEPISIALWSPDDIDQVSVHASDLRGSAGVIPATNLDIKVIKWWYQRSRRSRWQSVLVPKFLLNDDSLVKVDLKERRNYLKLSFPDGNRYVDPPSYAANGAIEEEPEDFPLRDSDSLQPFDLVGGQHKQVWVTVKVPDKAGAGRYSGDLLFKAGVREIARFKVVVQVLPFSLPAPKTRYDPSQEYAVSFYYRGRLNSENRGKVGFMTKSEQQFRAELQMMYDHGIVAPLMLLGGHLPGAVRPLPLFRKHLAIMREIGMAGRPLYLGENCRMSDLDLLRELVREVVSSAREYGFTDVYFYGQDEAPTEIMKANIPSWQTVHEAGAKVQVAVTYDYLDLQPDELDLLIAFGDPNQTAGRQRAARRHRLGLKISCYAFPHTSNPDPLIYRRACGLIAWSNDYDGVTPYCFMHNGKGAWNDLDDIDTNIAFPTVNGAISTLALEALREGADDVRYATLLMTRIEEARKSRRSRAVAVAKEASEWIEKEDFSTADLDSVRSRMVEYITRLTR